MERGRDAKKPGRKEQSLRRTAPKEYEKKHEKRMNFISFKYSLSAVKMSCWLDLPDLICTRAWNRTICWKDFNCHSFNSTLMYEILPIASHSLVDSLIRSDRTALWQSFTSISPVSIRCCYSSHQSSVVRLFCSSGIVRLLTLSSLSHQDWPSDTS